MGNVAKTDISLNYDIFMLDYRGYGKSEGKIRSLNQSFEDNQMIFNEFKKKYQEKDIIILVHLIGTGLVSKLASDNNAIQLVLQAPYLSLTDMMCQRFFIHTNHHFKI